jgi:hypothetical protein
MDTRRFLCYNYHTPLPDEEDEFSYFWKSLHDNYCYTIYILEKLCDILLVVDRENKDNLHCTYYMYTGTLHDIDIIISRLCECSTISACIGNFTFKLYNYVDAIIYIAWSELDVALLSNLRLKYIEMTRIGHLMCDVLNLLIILRQRRQCVYHYNEIDDDIIQHVLFQISKLVIVENVDTRFRSIRMNWFFI